MWKEILRKIAPLCKHYSKSVDYVNRYYTEQKPDEMGFQEWEKKRLTKGKVLAYLRRIIKNQNAVHKEEIRLVKRNYSLKLKAYSPKMQARLNQLKTTKEISFNEMVLADLYPFEDNSYKKLFKAKQKAYHKQSKLFDGMDREPVIEQYYDCFENDLLC